MSAFSNLTTGRLKVEATLVDGSGNVIVTTSGVPIVYGKTVTYVPVAQGAAGTTVIAAADATKKHKIIGAMLVMSAAGTLKFTDSSGDLTGASDIAANAGFVWSTSIIPYIETGAVNRAINLVTTVGAAKGFVALVTEA